MIPVRENTEVVIISLIARTYINIYIYSYMPKYVAHLGLQFNYNASIQSSGSHKLVYKPTDQFLDRGAPTVG